MDEDAITADIPASAIIVTTRPNTLALKILNIRRTSQKHNPLIDSTEFTVLIVLALQKIQNGWSELSVRFEAKVTHSFFEDRSKVEAFIEVLNMKLAKTIAQIAVWKNGTQKQMTLCCAVTVAGEQTHKLRLFVPPVKSTIVQIAQRRLTCAMDRYRS